MPRKKTNNQPIIIAIIIIIIAIVVAGCYVAFNPLLNNIQTRYIEKHSPNSVEIKVPAVDNRGNGVVGKIKTTVENGTGQILVNIDILTGFLTQDSIKTAAAVASNLTNITLQNLDITYKAEVNATAVDGPSAGAALTIATIFALENKTLPDDVMITGTINPDGTIGRVGGVLAKARASKEAGANIFLVPKGQGVYEEIKKKRECEKKEGPGFVYEYCTIKYIPQKISIGEELNLTVVEVETISDALKYFSV